MGQISWIIFWKYLCAWDNYEHNFELSLDEMYYVVNKNRIYWQTSLLASEIARVDLLE